MHSCTLYVVLVIWFNFLFSCLCWCWKPMNQQCKHPSTMRPIQLIQILACSRANDQSFNRKRKHISWTWQEFSGHFTLSSNCYQQHHLQVKGVFDIKLSDISEHTSTIQKCGLPHHDKHDHQIIITHYLTLFPYQQGHILLRQTLIFQSYTMKTLCTTEAKDNDMWCPCSNTCHQWITECSTPFSTSVFPLCCQARDPKFTLT